MKPLPLPLRVAAGLAVTAAEQARELPKHLVGLPVTMMSQVLQFSMRLQQQVTELAIKGDEALSSLRPVEDTPSWATFDEDLPPAANGTPARNGFRGLSGFQDTEEDARDPWEQEERALAEDHAEGEFDSTAGESGLTAGPDNPATGHATTDPDSGGAGTTGMDPVGTTGSGSAAPDTEPSGDVNASGSAGTDSAAAADSSGASDAASRGVAGATEAASAGTIETQIAGPASTGGVGAGSSGAPQIAGHGAAESAEPATSADTEAGTAAAGATEAGPIGIANYDELTLPQLRARLRRFGLDELEELLAYERAHENRPSFVGMLARRIGNVQRLAGGSGGGQSGD